MSRTEAGRRVGLRARRTDPSEPRTYRLANSIRLPWGIGLALFLLLAVGAGLMLGRSSERDVEVPNVVLDYQESITNDAAQSVRRGVNEGIDDLAELAAAIEAAGSTDAVDLEQALNAVGELHGRYLTIYVLDGEGSVLASAGLEPTPALLPEPPPYDEAGMFPATTTPEGDGVLLQQFAPFEIGGQSGAVVGHYDPGFLGFPLEGALPGEAWVVDDEGRTVGGIAEVPALGSLPRQTLREAAEAGARGNSGVTSVAGSLDRAEVIGYAPVVGVGPAGQQGWSVVTTRSVRSMSLPETDKQRQGLLIAVVIAILSLLVFSWLYIVVLRPVFKLQREAERLAFGDLTKNVEVVRYDEIGLIARALERMRILLIRKRAERPPRT